MNGDARASLQRADGVAASMGIPMVQKMLIFLASTLDYIKVVIPGLNCVFKN